MAQPVESGSEHLAHPSNLDHDTNPDGWFLEYAPAGRAHGSCHHHASEHLPCAHHHLKDAQPATPLLSMGALRNRAFPLHSFTGFHAYQANILHQGVGFCSKRLCGKVSVITNFTTTPERNVS